MGIKLVFIAAIDLSRYAFSLFFSWFTLLENNFLTFGSDGLCRLSTSPSSASFDASVGKFGCIYVLHLAVMFFFAAFPISFGEVC